MRRGFWKELKSVFDESISLLGGTCHPDDIPDEIASREALHKEVRTALKMWENQTKATMRALGADPKKKAVR